MATSLASIPSHYFLTGATGLLGEYLLRDLLDRGADVAVFARPARKQTAAQRIESIIRRWEQDGVKYKRPTVIEGDLAKPMLGVSDDKIEWLSANCHSVIHCGASVSFLYDAKQTEPYRSNIDGTRNLLNLCKRASIREFHHISTAYICGTRGGKILESDFDCDQEFGNDYERSKFVAESFVRSADFLDQVTIYRPSIIVGDSQTGYTSTYHGFYTPLRLGNWLSNHDNHLSLESVLDQLGLNGDDLKNVVPVDWIAQVVTRIVDSKELHGRTYHMTNPNPVPVKLLYEAIVQSVRNGLKANPRKKRPAAATGNMPESEEFGRQMKAYRAYFRQDPDFDTQNTHNAAADVPCPVIDFDMLVRLGDYAIASDFGYRKPANFIASKNQDPVVVQLNKLNTMDDSEFEFDEIVIGGDGGGTWQVAYSGSTPVAVRDGAVDSPLVSVYLHRSTLDSAIDSPDKIEALVDMGRIVLSGAPPRMDGLTRRLHGLCTYLASGSPTRAAELTDTK
jgi:thioester reductase-like protein